MSLKILTSNLKLARWGVLAWSGIVFLYALFVVYLYPIISESSQAIMGYVNSMPDAVKAAFGMEGTMTEMLSLESFAAVEFFSFWPLLIGIYGIFVCVGIAREMEQGTLDLLMAQPVPRYRVILGKFAVFIVSAFLIAVFSILGIIAGAATVDTPVNLGSISLVFVEAFLLVLALGSVTLSVRPYFSSRVRRLWSPVCSWDFPISLILWFRRYLKRSSGCVISRSFIISSPMISLPICPLMVCR